MFMFKNPIKKHLLLYLFVVIFVSRLLCQSRSNKSVFTYLYTYARDVIKKYRDYLYRSFI